MSRVESQSVAIVQIPIAEIVPYVTNPRVHPEAQIEALVKLIERVGFRVPILLDGDNVIIGGHGRLIAARRLGMTEVPAIISDDLSPDEVKAWRIADNRIAEMAEWDVGLLEMDLQTIDFEDFDLETIGFSTIDLDDLGITLGAGLSGPAAGGDPEPGPDDGKSLARVDLLIDDPTHQVATGDQWRVGPHTLFCTGVVLEWPEWIGHLQGDDVAFCPFPGPLVPLAPAAGEKTLVMVQPDGYLAGHLIDRYAEVHGADSVSLLHRRAS